MAEKYIVYQYVKNKIHDCDYKKLLQRQNLSQSNKGKRKIIRRIALP